MATRVANDARLRCFLDPLLGLHLFSGAALCLLFYRYHNLIRVISLYSIFVSRCVRMQHDKLFYSVLFFVLENEKINTFRTLKETLIA